MKKLSALLALLRADGTVLAACGSGREFIENPAGRTGDRLQADAALAQQAFAYILKGEGDEVVISTVERALASLPGEEPEAAAEAAPASQDPIASLKEYIHAHLNEDLSLSRLSEVCHFHPVYMSRVFKEAEGVTVGDYINRVRLEKAKELLTGSRLTVLEISRQMGFATDNYFCRWFRRQTGFSPHRFREK